jgi:hypothetical protein
MATVASVGVGTLQWLTLEKTDVTQKAAQRAWVEPRALLIDSGRAAGEKFTYTLSYVNVGNEPATNVVVQTDPYAVSVSERSQAIGWIAGENRTCDIAHPNSGGIVIWPSARDANPKRLTYYSDGPPPNAEEVIRGEKFLVIDGCIGYETVGTVRYSGFCFYMRPNGHGQEQWQVVPCMNHNFAR